MRPHSLFRWTPAAIALWLSGALFAVFGVLNIWLARLSSRGALPYSGGGGTSNTHSLLRGAAENGAIAALCILGWYFLRRRTPASLPAGTLAVTVALFITVRRWLHWQLAGTNQLPWAEPLLVWPFLLYAIVYGYRESRACVGA
jgi:hypothetical protein